MIRKQTTRTVLMVRPANFGFNEETAVNNAFQTNNTALTTDEISKLALEEFDNFVATLRSKKIEVVVYDENPLPVKPDSVFPNNWISFHEDGTVITYPMFSPVRRLERSDDLIDLLEKSFWVIEHIHLENSEDDDVYLEGTGSIVLDRVNRIAFACLSPRTDKVLFEDWCKIAGYSPLSFTSIDQNGQLVYHTNVMMALGESFVVICLDSVIDDEEKLVLKDVFAKTNKEVIEISLAQMNSFAGNMLQLQNSEGKTFLVMSDSAYNSLDATQKDSIEEHTEILHQNISIIESYGGGSVRCMLAEVFLPEKNLS